MGRSLHELMLQHKHHPVNAYVCSSGGGGWDRASVLYFLATARFFSLPLSLLAVPNCHVQSKPRRAIQLVGLSFHSDPVAIGSQERMGAGGDMDGDWGAGVYSKQFQAVRNVNSARRSFFGALLVSFAFSRTTDFEWRVLLGTYISISLTMVRGETSVRVCGAAASQ